MSLKGITWVWNAFDSKMKYKIIEGTLWFNFLKIHLQKILIGRINKKKI